MSAVITALREATGSAHRGLEADLDAERLCASRSRYTEFITALYGFHVAAEAVLGDLDVPGLASPPSRTALLATDLRALGVDPAAVPVMPAFLDPERAGARYGLLYVVEGSALGGTVLARMVLANLGLGPDGGAAFFGAGAANPARWREVKAVLEREVASAQVAAAAHAASATFDALTAWMHAQGVASKGS